MQAHAVPKLIYLPVVRTREAGLTPPSLRVQVAFPLQPTGKGPHSLPLQWLGGHHQPQAQGGQEFAGSAQGNANLTPLYPTKV